MRSSGSAQQDFSPERGGTRNNRASVVKPDSSGYCVDQHQPLLLPSSAYRWIQDCIEPMSLYNERKSKDRNGNGEERIPLLPLNMTSDCADGEELPLSPPSLRSDRLLPRKPLIFFSPSTAPSINAIPSLIDSTNSSISSSNSLLSPLNLHRQRLLQEEREQALRDYKVTIEYKHLKSHAPGGVYLIPSLDDLRLFFGIIFVRRGLYTNGIFKFKLRLPPKYNDINQHPQLTFTSSVYNPYVDPNTGALEISAGYPKWDPSKHYLVTVLTFLKKIFYAKSFDEATANPTARELASTDPSAYRQQVEDCVRQSQKLVYNLVTDEEAVQHSLANFTEEQLGHRVLRDLLKANVKDPSTVSKTALLSMISKASTV